MAESNIVWYMADRLNLPEHNVASYCLTWIARKSLMNFHFCFLSSERALNLKKQKKIPLFFCLQITKKKLGVTSTMNFVRPKGLTT